MHIHRVKLLMMELIYLLLILTYDILFSFFLSYEIIRREILISSKGQHSQNADSPIRMIEFRRLRINIIHSKMK